MIYNYPYFGFPNYTKYMAQTYPYNYYGNNYSKQNNSVYNNQPNKNKQIYNQNNSKYDSSYKIKKLSSSNTNTGSTPLFNLFGIQLYFDDVLLICIILFLYNEKIEDNYLLIALILLLLS